MSKQRRRATAKAYEGRKRGNGGSEIGKGTREEKKVSSAPTIIPTYGGKMRAASFHINCDVTHAHGKQPHACRPCHTRLPTPRHALEAWEAQRAKRLTAVKTAPPARAPFLGLAQRRDCAYVWPRPGGSCRCTKRGVHFLYPYNYARAV